MLLLLQVVAPKRAALAEANRKLEAANKKLTGIRAKVKELQDKVAALEESFMKATEDKNAAIAQVCDLQTHARKHEQGTRLCCLFPERCASG
jgi:dynein heavy chain